MAPPTSRSKLMASRLAAKVSMRDFTPEQIRSAAKAVVAVGVWYLFACVSTVINRILLRGATINPITLTCFHVLVSVTCDVLLLFGPVGPKFSAVPLQDVVRTVAPLSCFMVFNKVFTYLSYGLVPVSLTHTVKASAPLFTVTVAWLWMQRRFPRPVYLSLVPIMSGVALASVSELDYDHAGFICAAMSALVNVFQNLYAKQLLQYNKFDVFNLHIYNGILSLLLLAPVTLCVEVLSVHSSQQSCLCQYLASQAAYLVLALVTDLTYTIMNTTKRLVIIASSVWWFATPLSPVNTLGMVLAMAGVGMYDWAKKHPVAHAERHAHASDEETGGTPSPSALSSTSLSACSPRLVRVTDDGVAYVASPMGEDSDQEMVLMAGHRVPLDGPGKRVAVADAV